MAELLLYHHAQGRTAGFLAFADELRAAGHTVHTPDLYDGKTFADARRGRRLRASRSASTRSASAVDCAADGPAERARLCRLLARGDAGAGCSPRHGPGAEGALLFSGRVPGLGVRRHMAAGSPAPDPHDGERRVGAGRPPGRARARRDRRRRGAVPVPRRPAPVRRQQPAGLRRAGRGGCSSNASSHSWSTPSRRQRHARERSELGRDAVRPLRDL